MPERSFTLNETEMGAIVQISGWSNFEQHATDAIRSLGFDALSPPSAATQAGDVILYRVAPDRLWLRSAAPDPQQLMDLTGPNLLALDLTQARRCLTLVDQSLEWVAATFLDHDLRPAHWPNGAVVQTGIHQISVLAHRRDENTLDLIVPTTWFASLQEYLDTVLCAATYDKHSFTSA